MKEATGELNMTVVTLIAVAALGAVFYLVVWPLIQRMLIQQTCNTYGDGWTAERNPDPNGQLNDSNAEVVEWQCCPSGTSFGGTGCIKAR